MEEIKVNTKEDSFRDRLEAILKTSHQELIELYKSFEINRTDLKKAYEQISNSRLKTEVKVEDKENSENQVNKIYSEVYSILRILGSEYKSKLTDNTYKLIKEGRCKEYNPTYASTVSLDKQEVKKESISIIAFLHLNYWCEDNKEEKIKLREIFDKNEDKYQEKLKEQKQLERKKEQVQKDIEENIEEDQLSIVVYKKSIFSKFFSKIKKMFSKKNDEDYTF